MAILAINGYILWLKNYIFTNLSLQSTGRGLWSAFESIWTLGSTPTAQILHNFTKLFKVTGPFFPDMGGHKLREGVQRLGIFPLNLFFSEGVP